MPGRLGCLRRGGPPGPAGRGAGQRPLAPVAWPRRGRAEGSRGALGLLGEGHAPAGGQAGRHHLGALAADPRTACPERRPARLRPPPEPLPQHRQALRPRQRAGAAAARPEIPPHPGRPPPRLPPQAPGRRARRPAPATAPGDPPARLPGQLQPACPLHQPGPPGQRPAAPITPPGRPDPAHQAGPPHRRPERDTRRAHRSLPRDDHPGQPRHIPSRPCWSPTRATTPGSASGSPTRAPRTCPTCTHSPAASTWTSRPPPPRSPSRTTTDAPRESTPRPFCGIRFVNSLVLCPAGRR